MKDKALAIAALLAAGLIAGLPFASSARADDPPSAAAGKALAIDACSACHLVADGQKPPPLVANQDEGSKVRAPNFADIAKLCLDSAALKAKITSPHYPMREQLFTPVDVDSLSLYIRSLTPLSSCAQR